MPTIADTYSLTYTATDTRGDTTSLSFQVVVDGQKIYWTLFFHGDRHGFITKSNVDGTGSERFRISRDWPNRIAVSDVRMYWIDSYDDDIRSSNLDGTNVGTLITTTHGDDIADITANDIKLYWLVVESTSSGEDTVLIRSANFDGTDSASLIRVGRERIGGYITASNNRLYWSIPSARDPDIWTIWGANIDGTGVNVVVSDVPTAFSTYPDIDVFGRHLYWIEPDRVNTRSGRIMRSNLDGTGKTVLISASQEEFVDGDFEPSAIDVGDSGIYWIEDVNGVLRRAKLDGTEVEIVVARTGKFGRGLVVR